MWNKNDVQSLLSDDKEVCSLARANDVTKQGHEYLASQLGAMYGTALSPTGIYNDQEPLFN